MTIERYAVIGNPIAHSRSPWIHAAFARQTGEAIVYDRILGPVGAFRETVEQFRAEGGRGLNVTLPFKLDACAYATRTSERATAAGAVNTLAFDGGEIVGDNTDGVGLVRDLERNLGLNLAGLRVLLLGAGGAAQGVVLPLLEREPAALVIANRTLAKAEALAQRFGRYGSVIAVAYPTLTDGDFDLVINATASSLGAEAPPLPGGVYRAGSTAYDMMYGKGETAFLRAALSDGAAHLADGLGMLVEQAAESFFIWRGRRPETGPVLRELRASL